MRVRGHPERYALVTVCPESAFAGPPGAVRRFCKVAVRGNPDAVTAAADLLKASVAFPAISVSRVSRIGIRRDRDSNTGTALCAIASIAFPAEAVYRLIEVTVLRNINGDTGVFSRPVSATAFPAVSAVGIDISVGGNIERNAGPVRFLEAATAFPTCSVGRGRCIPVFGYFDSIALATRLLEARFAAPSAPVTVCWIEEMRWRWLVRNCQV